MQPTPYLFFNDGLCREAMTFYADVLGGEMGMVMTGADMPPEFPIEDRMKDWLIHSEVDFDGGKLMGSDSVMAPSQPMAGVAVMVSLPTKDAAEIAFKRFAESGTVTMPFEPTFWSAGFGMVTDKYDVQWMVTCDDAA